MQVYEEFVLEEVQIWKWSLL